MLGEVQATGWGDGISTCNTLSATNAHVHLAGATGFLADTDGAPTASTPLEAWDTTNQAETAPSCTEEWNLDDRIVQCM